MQPGQLIVITGPSGVGKGTLVRHLLTRFPNLYLSVSATTRAPRPGEIEGKDYYFLDRPGFEEKIAAGQFLEWAEYAGNYYGTPQSAIANQLAAGQTVILEIELEGARQVCQSFPQGRRIFILPPSFEELERRLRGRGKDTEAAIARRLERAQEELAASDEFEYQIVNDDLETALDAIEKIIFSC
jgi:guanylate kinase